MGGTAILIKTDIQFEVISHPFSTNNSFIEFCIIKLETTGPENVFIISVHARNDNRILFVDKLHSLFDSLQLHQNHNYYIMAGDFNARRRDWEDRVYKQRGYISQWDTNSGLIYKVNIITLAQPTYKPAHSYLDICLLDSRLIILDWINDKLA